MNPQFDAIIIGAGPAGSTAARFLASGGLKVLLIEKSKLPRYKVCGGGLVWRARKALEIPLNGIIESEFSSISWKFSDELNFTIERPYPLISMVMRDRFDAFLCDKASEAGALIHDGETFESYDETEASVIRVKTDKDIYHTRYLLAADGLRSNVLRQMNWKDTRIKVPAIEAEISVDQPELFNEVIFDVSAISRGYGWIFPKAGHLSVGIAAMPQKGLSLRTAYREYLEKTGIKPRITGEKQYGYQIPLRPHQNLHQDNILLLGDAAGLADPLVAEGISHAIFSGKWAAEALLLSEKNAGACYEKIVRKNLNGQIRAARFCSRLFYNYPELCERILKRKGSYISGY
ncbi:MAG: geranylgeranyl reductase family protein, partial [Cyclobacteriaceae bacterium]